jgi:hypothetical protein
MQFAHCTFDNPANEIPPDRQFPKRWGESKPKMRIEIPQIALYLAEE